MGSDLHHTIPYGDGGPTHASNLKCLCRLHHLLITLWNGVANWRDRQLHAGHYCAGMKKWLSRGQRCEVSRVIACPADVLYAMVSDVSRMGEWSPENIGGRSTNVEVTAAEPRRLFEFVVHLVWPLTYLVTWGYRFEPQSGSTLVTQYRQDHRPTWWAWVGSKGLRISGPDAHYAGGMEATLEALANAVGP